LVLNLRAVDDDEYLRVGIKGAHGSRELALGVANALCYGQVLQDPTKSDLCILSLLSQHPHRDVRSVLLHGLAGVGRSQRYQSEVISLALGTEIGDDSELAEGLTTIFHPSSVDPDALTEQEAATILNKIVPIRDLDRQGQSYHLSSFVDWTCGKYPEVAFEFVLKRLDYESALEVGCPYQLTYQAVPDHGIRPQFRGFVRSQRYALLLSDVRDRLAIKGHSANHLVDLFWSMGDLNAETLAAIDEWIHSGDRDKLRWAMRLLREGPKILAMTRPYFAVHVVETVSQVSRELGRDAMGVFIGHARTRGWEGSFSEPPKAMAELRDMALELAGKMTGSAVGSGLFQEIASTIDRQIREWKPEGQDGA
jgi:hypothetical protein